MLFFYPWISFNKFIFLKQGPGVETHFISPFMQMKGISDPAVYNWKAE